MPRASVLLAAVAAAAAAATGGPKRAGHPLSMERVPSVRRAGRAVAPPRADSGNCPSWPFLTPVDLPSPLPDTITQALATINATLYSQIEPQTMPGFAVAIHYNGKPLAEWGGGVATIGQPRAPSAVTDLFRIASNTKIFMSLLATIFEERGYLHSLDDAVSTYVPGFAPVNTFIDGSEITFRQLMSHTSGLPDSLAGLGDWGNMTTAQVLAALAVTPLQVPPGTLPEYSNLGISMLGHALAEFVAPAAERGDVGALVSKYIIQPLGLTSTGYYYTNASVLARLITGYDDNGNVVTLQDLGWDAPCGCMYSTPHELNLVHQALAAAAAGTDGPSPLGISTNTARRFLGTVYAWPDFSMLVGTPWEQAPVPAAAGGYYIPRTKSGTLSGYATKSGLIPELRLSFAFQYNGNFDDWYSGDATMRSVVGTIADAIVEVITPLQPLPATGPSPLDYVGTYEQDIAPGTYITVAYNTSRTRTGADGSTTGSGVLTLTMNPGDQVGTLEWVTGDVFRWYNDPTAANCEHVFMGDAPWGWPLYFTRSGGAGSAVVSVTIADNTGPWSKQ